MKDNDGIIQKIAFRLIRKYIAGLTISSVLKTVRDVNDKGMQATVTLLNDHVTDVMKAKYNANAYAQLIRQMVRLRLNSGVSLRPSQLGYSVNKSTFMKNISDISELAKANNVFIWLEDENTIARGKVFDLYGRVKKIYQGVGVEVVANLEGIPEEVFDLGKNDNLRLWYTSKFGGKNSESKKHQAHIGKLSSRVTILSHDIKWINRMAQNGLNKKNITFEMPLGYNRGKLSLLAAKGKSKSAFGVYVPYGKDWMQYVKHKIADGKMRGIAMKMLSDTNDEKNGKGAKA